MLNRRRFLLASSVLLAAPLTSFAQPATKVRRIGYLDVGVSTNNTRLPLLLESLRTLGYEEGQNLTVEKRYFEGKQERLSEYAEDLVRRNVELIVAAGARQSIAAAKAATRTVPIVMFSALAPIEDGFVASLAHPGGNITGTAWAPPETIHRKLVQLLKEAMPRATRIALIFDPTTLPPDTLKRSLAEVDRLAVELGITTQIYHVTRAEELGPVLEQIGASRPNALLVYVNPPFRSRLGEIAAYAIKHKLISMSASSVYVDAGGLFSYGPSFTDTVDRTASYVDRILKGAKPSELPVEEPAKYDMVINLSTAKALGFKIPPSILVRANRVIE